MKKIAILAAMLFLPMLGFAQRTAFINTETVFRALPEYETALAGIDAFARSEQEKVDADFARIAEMYERYQHQRSALSEGARRQVEDNIIRMEKEATQRQTEVFGNDGTVMRMRIEKLKPIQDRVFGVVDMIGKQHQYDAIVDISNNPSIVFYNKDLDVTQEVLRSLGINK